MSPALLAEHCARAHPLSASPCHAATLHCCSTAKLTLQYCNAATLTLQYCNTATLTPQYYKTETLTLRHCDTATLQPCNMSLCTPLSPALPPRVCCTAHGFKPEGGQHRSGTPRAVDARGSTLTNLAAVQLMGQSKHTRGPALASAFLGLLPTITIHHHRTFKHMQQLPQAWLGEGGALPAHNSSVVACCVGHERTDHCTGLGLVRTEGEAHISHISHISQHGFLYCTEVEPQTPTPPRAPISPQHSTGWGLGGEWWRQTGGDGTRLHMQA